jgi:hypothetical protein
MAAESGSAGVPAQPCWNRCPTHGNGSTVGPGHSRRENTHQRDATSWHCERCNRELVCDGFAGRLHGTSGVAGTRAVPMPGQGPPAVAASHHPSLSHPEGPEKWTESDYTAISSAFASLCAVGCQQSARSALSSAQPLAGPLALARCARARRADHSQQEREPGRHTIRLASTLYSREPEARSW